MRGAGRPRPGTVTADAPWRGALLMAATVTLQRLNQAVAKYLAADLPVIEIVWGRLLFHCILALRFVIAGHGMRGLRAPNPGIQVVRGGLFCGATILLFAALAYIPMADAIALLFVAPLVVTALSPLLLGEHVGPRRWIAVLSGFRRRADHHPTRCGRGGMASLFALGSAVTYAFYLIVTRRVTGAAPLAATLAYTALVGLVHTSATLPFLWVAPTPGAWAWLAFSGAASALAHLCLIRAYDYAEASLIAPISYGEIVMATILGFLIFGDFPDAVVWIGVTVIVSTGFYVSLRGHRGNARARRRGSTMSRIPAVLLRSPARPVQE